MSKNIRLRINALAKFYISIRADATLAELKRLIGGVLVKSYGLTIGSVRLRSEDGYEVLECFSVGDVLEDNQVVCVDPERPYSEAVPSGRAKEGVSGPLGASEGLGTFYKKNEEYLRRKEESMRKGSEYLKKKNSEAPKSGTVPVRELAPQSSGGKEPQSSVAVVPATAEKQMPLAPIKSHDIFAKAPDAPIKVHDIFAKTEKPAEQADPSEKAGDGWASDSKFKGFAIKKKEFEKSNSQFTVSDGFKPLKKRKQEEVFEPI